MSIYDYLTGVDRRDPLQTGNLFFFENLPPVVNDHIYWMTTPGLAVITGICHASMAALATLLSAGATLLSSLIVPIVLGLKKGAGYLFDNKSWQKIEVLPETRSWVVYFGKRALLLGTLTVAFVVFEALGMGLLSHRPLFQSLVAYKLKIEAQGTLAALAPYEMTRDEEGYHAFMGEEAMAALNDEHVVDSLLKIDRQDLLEFLSRVEDVMSDFQVRLWKEKGRVLPASEPLPGPWITGLLERSGANTSWIPSKSS